MPMNGFQRVFIELIECLRRGGLDFGIDWSGSTFNKTHRVLRWEWGERRGQEFGVFSIMPEREAADDRRTKKGRGLRRSRDLF